jgi:hypothetical protein
MVIGLNRTINYFLIKIFFLKTAEYRFEQINMFLQTKTQNSTCFYLKITHNDNLRTTHVKLVKSSKLITAFIFFIKQNKCIFAN